MSVLNVVSGLMMYKNAWKLSDLEKVPKNGLKVFSCFHCGGGSTMGYKLAGYDVLGGVEIDPEMMALYRENHKPKHSYLMPIQEFNKIPNKDLPEELFNLDILDGSPPCSSFSMAGNREKNWGDDKHFREGQAKQVLDDLFFHYIDTAVKLRPKVVIAENVKGLVLGNAKGYVKQINEAFELAGYKVQLFLLNAAFMGVPQRRERVFFIAQQKKLFKPLKLQFNEPIISINEAIVGTSNDKSKWLGKETKQFLYWTNSKDGETFQKVSKSGWFSHRKIKRSEPCSTITAHAPTELYHDKEPRMLSPSELIRLQSFPDDYNFLDKSVGYFCGMSVPPIMMQKISKEIYRQLFS